MAAAAATGQPLMAPNFNAESQQQQPPPAAAAAGQQSLPANLQYHQVMSPAGIMHSGHPGAAARMMNMVHLQPAQLAAVQAEAQNASLPPNVGQGQGNGGQQQHIFFSQANPPPPHGPPLGATPPGPPPPPHAQPPPSSTHGGPPPPNVGGQPLNNGQGGNTPTPSPGPAAGIVAYAAPGGQAVFPVNTSGYAPFMVHGLPPHMTPVVSMAGGGMHPPPTAMHHFMQQQQPQQGAQGNAGMAGLAALARSRPPPPPVVGMPQLGPMPPRLPMLHPHILIRPDLMRPDIRPRPDLIQDLMRPMGHGQVRSKSFEPF